MALLTPVLFLLLALPGGFSEVVDHFAQTCPQFFINPEGTVCTPTVFPDQIRYKQICQLLHRGDEIDTYEYATLYDTENRIPVFSAYTFEHLMECERKTAWFIEPQLESSEADSSMVPDNSGAELPHQAVNRDYIGSGYDRGHLAPVYHARSQRCSDTTFTLTNAAPQASYFKEVPWRSTEKEVAQILMTDCAEISKYIVTGVVPGSSMLKNRVRVPSYFWTAYACLDNNLQVTTAGAYLGMNTNNSCVIRLSVMNLDTILGHLYELQDFSVFCGHSFEPITAVHGRFCSADQLMRRRLTWCQKCSPAYNIKRCVERVLYGFFHAKSKMCRRAEN